MPQLAVLFRRFPDLDPESLLRVVRGHEPGRESCAMEPVLVRARADSRRLGATSFQIGECRVGVVVTESRLPEGAAGLTIGTSPWKPEVKAGLLAHESFAALRCVGPGSAIDRWVAVYKAAMALLEADGLGIANEETWSAFPAEIAGSLATPDAWDRLREEAMPVELVTGFVTAELPGVRWHVSRGHEVFGFPDLAMRSTGRSEDAYALFKNLFLYMFAQGRPVGPGDTADVAGGTRVEFREPTDAERKSLGSPCLILQQN